MTVPSHRTEAAPHCAIGLRPVDPCHCHFHEQRDNSECADRDERDRCGLARGPIQALRHEEPHPKTKGGARQAEQAVQRQRLCRFWNG